MKLSYRCAKCGGSVSKEPVMTDKDGNRLHGLHGWSCSNGCKPPVKVTRTIVKTDGDKKV